MGVKLALLARQFLTSSFARTILTMQASKYYSDKAPTKNKDWRHAISQEKPRYISLFITYDNDKFFLNSTVLFLNYSPYR